MNNKFIIFIITILKVRLFYFIIISYLLILYYTENA